MGEKRKPAHEFRLGLIRATIWENQTENQDVWFKVTFSRLYRDQDQWKDTDSFRHDDLPVVAKAADMAYSLDLAPANGAREVSYAKDEK